MSHAQMTLAAAAILVASWFTGCSEKPFPQNSEPSKMELPKTQLPVPGSFDDQSYVPPTSDFKLSQEVVAMQTAEELTQTSSAADDRGAVTVASNVDLAASVALDPKLEWRKLADLNDPRGFAGQFVGVSNGKLLLYGGTNFPDKPVWDGGVKGWYRDVFVLDDLDAEWKKIGPLAGERAVGYGVSLPYEDGFLCIGGADAEKHVTDVFALTYDGKELKARDLPKLPKPCAYMNGGQIGDVIYLAGGLDKPDAVKTMRTFWSLDLKNLDAGWKELEPWPGLPRMLAVSAVLDGKFYLMSGVDLFPDAAGKPMRIYHRDSYCYEPGKGWTKLADAPTPIVAAPSPSMTAGDKIVVFGGDEGRLLGFKPMEKHPGFPKTIWTYDVKSDAWLNIGIPPYIPVAVPLVNWKEGYVAASGEIRPAVRSRETWWVKPK